MRFKEGQQVVCVLKNRWVAPTHGITSAEGPKFNEIVTIKQVNGEYLCIYGYETYQGTPCDYNSKWFVSVISDSELESLLSEIPETVTINP